ncbi:MAG: DUF4439 domain-containing protein [Lapillicoccus sp.]
MPSDASYARGRTTRRTALGAAGWVTGLVGLAALSGCGIRVGQPEPSLTPPPARQPVADEAELLTALGDALRLAGDAAATAPQSGGTRLLAAVHAEHAVALRAVLRAAGVPDLVVASSLSSPSAGPSASSTGKPGATPTTAPSRLPVSPGQLAGAEGAAVSAQALGGVAGTTSAHRPVLVAVATRRALAVTALGGTVAWPASNPLPAAAAAALLTPTRAVVYGFEVITARLPEPERAPALATLTALRQREAGLTSLAGDAAAPEPLGYDLPFPVASAADARRLATTILTGLVARGLDPLAAVPLGSSAVGTVVRLQTEALSLGSPWGVVPPSLPGMVYP